MMCHSRDVKTYFEFGKPPLGMGVFGVVHNAKVKPPAREEIPEFMPGGVAETVEHVAIKRVALDSLAWKEIEIMKSVDIPGSMKYYGCFYESPNPHVFIVMELCGGQSLADIIVGKKRILKPDCANRILLDVADVLIYLHSVGIVHRDIKPANIMICGGEIKIIDYGLSIVLDNKSHSFGEKSGTANYLDPWLPDRELARYYDWWAWGQLAAFLATGRTLLRPADIDTSGPIVDYNGRKYQFLDPKDILGINPLLGDLLSLLADPRLEPSQRPNMDYIRNAIMEARAQMKPCDLTNIFE
jgi:serine/threonine protein kinase